MDKRYLILIILILVASSFFRLYNINDEAIYKDEGLSLRSATKGDLIDTIATAKKIEATPPVYFMLLHVWVKIFGDGTFSSRFLSALVDILAGVFVFLLAKELFGIKTGIIAMLIHSFATINIIYSQDIRMYTLFFLFSVLSTLFFVYSIKKNNSSILLNASYVVSTLLLLYTHFFGILLFFLNILSYYIYLRYQSRDIKKMKKLILPLCIILMFSVPNIIAFFEKRSEVSGGIFESLVNKYGLPKLLYDFNVASLIIFFVVGFIIFFGLLKFIEINKKNIRKILSAQEFLIFAPLVMFAIYCVVSFIFPEPIFITRYPIFIYGFIYIMCAKFITSIKNRNIEIIVISIILIFNVLATINYYSVQTKPQWREISGEIENNYNEGDVVFIQRGSTRLAFERYFGLDLNVTDVSNGRNYYSEDYLTLEDDKNPKKLDGFIKDGAWLITAKPHSRSELYVRYLSENYNKSLEKNYHNINLYYFEK